MNYTDPKISEAAAKLKQQIADNPDSSDILKSPVLKELFEELKNLPADKKASWGAQVNALRDELIELTNKDKIKESSKPPIDITAPFDANLKPTDQPKFLASEFGSIHPITKELNIILDILYRMGFQVIESREIDDDYHMFTSLNFPEDHPARDDYDTFITEQRDKDDKPLIAPAHTSTMQNRVLSSLKSNLDNDEPIAVVIPGRVFRNEDLDARHEHTFYQLEGVYVDKNIHTGHLIATLKTLLQSYYKKELAVKTQPFYFPFTEPSFEFSLSCPFCDQKGCQVCSFVGWIELLGCGMIHPNVLRQAGIDVNKYTGFAWGGGIERLVMMKYSIEDIRYFQSARLDFLRQFS